MIYGFFHKSIGKRGKERKRMKEEAVNKLVMLYRLKLPEDIIREICGFCFYDKETSFNRQQKRNIIMSAFAGSTFTHGYDLQHWWFWLNVDGDINPQFQCIFCSECGNYVQTNNGDTISNSAICQCFF